MTPIDELCKIISRTKPSTEKEVNYHSEIAPLAFASKIQVEQIEKQLAIAIKALNKISNGHSSSAIGIADDAIDAIDNCE